MSDKPFFDTSVLVYTLGHDEERSSVADRLLEAGGVLSVQVLNELAAVACRKLGMSWDDVRGALAAISVLCPLPIALSTETHDEGVRLAARYGFQIYDALIVAAAMEAGCNILYAEHLQDGQTVDGRVTIRNPFRG